MHASMKSLKTFKICKWIIFEAGLDTLKPLSSELKMLELERDQAIYKGTVGPTVSEQELGIRDLNTVTSFCTFGK